MLSFAHAAPRVPSLRSIALSMTCACGGGSSAVIAPASPSAVPHAVVTDSAVKTCPRAPEQRPSDCQAIATTADSKSDPDIRSATFALRSDLFAHERDWAEANRRFATSDGSTDEERAAQLERVLAEIDARERCGDPQVSSPEKFVGADHDPSLVFFSGGIPTDAGGVGDLATWGLLAVHDGCDWKRVAIGLTASPIARFRDSAGRRVLVQSHVVDQCREEVRAFVVNSAEPEFVFKTMQSRSDMVESGVCSDVRHVDPIESAGVLHGFRTMNCADDPCTLIEETVLPGSSAIVASTRAGAPAKKR